jgi:fructosamine-3-kinase
LDSFQAEVRFYREIAPVIGVRVPACYRAEGTEDGTVLVLEDLAEWQPGADPLIAARVLSRMHHKWADQANVRWPWLRPVGTAVNLVEELFTRVWPQLAAGAVAVQGLLSLSDTSAGTQDAAMWVQRLDAAANRLSTC